jgi:fatty acid desaturase
MEKASNQFSIREARNLVKDLSVPNPKIYWSDFLASIIVGHAAIVLLNRLCVVGRDLFSSGYLFGAVALGLFAISAICYMRAILFIHELVHLPDQGFTGFRVVWNALCGIPLLVPSFLYYPHIDHHRRKHYGTDRDGEYLELSHQHPANILLFIAAALVVPLAGFIRFSLLTPLAWIVPGFRLWVERRASSMIIDIFYLRGDFGPQATRTMRWQELACFLWCAALFAGWYFGRIQNVAVVNSYALGVTLVLMNNVRTLGAHRWIGDGRELTFEEQLLDSVNYPHRWWITELWGPVGTRYHAIHHLFPSMPYHNLGIAHRRLMAGLPADSLYRQTERVSLIATIIELWQRSRRRNKMPVAADRSSTSDLSNAANESRNAA